MRVAVNSYAVDRHTPISTQAHFAGSWPELCALVEMHLADGRPGRRAHTLVVPVPAERFRCGLVAVSERLGLGAQWVRPTGLTTGPPHWQVHALNARKPRAHHAEVIIYGPEALAALATRGVRPAGGADWEILFLAARLGATAPPPLPVMLARGILDLPGGLAGNATAVDLARAVVFWSTHVPTSLEATLADDADLPPLVAGTVRRSGGPARVAVWTTQSLPLPRDAPALPLTWAEAQLAGSGAAVEPPRAGAEIIWYWSCRPWPLPDEATAV